MKEAIRMNSVKQSPVLTLIYSISVVVMLIFLPGCAVPPSSQPALLRTETRTIVEELVKNPETGAYEMKIVSETHTKKQFSKTGNLVSGHSVVEELVKNPETGVYEKNPETGVYEKRRVISETHTKTQTGNPVTD